MARRRNKTKDMARSILPCRNREAAKQGKARVARRGRRRAKQALHAGREGEVEVVERERRVAARQQARWRQDGDKVNHFCRWGRARTKHLPPEERVTALRSQLESKGLITEHALQHFEHEAERGHLEHRRARQAAWVAYRLRRNRAFAGEDALRALLLAALEVDHGRLNQTLKTLDVRPCDDASPCHAISGTTACRDRPLVRARQDVYCVARRVWRTGARWTEDPSAVDAALLEVLTELGVCEA